jgi:hypothetical protein
MIYLWMLCVALIMGLAVSLFYTRKFKRMERRQYENSCVWHNLFMEERDNYRALEQGRDEESSDYEQLYISQQEALVERDGTISTLQKDRQLLFVIAMWHEMHCLPDLELLGDGGVIDSGDLEDIKLRMGVSAG